MPIVFTGDDEDDISWCDPPCDARLYERKDGSKICSYCGREYLPDSINKHKRKLGPSKGRYSDDGPILEPMTEYGQTPNKRKGIVLDREEKAMAQKKSGFHWTEIEQWPPEK